MTMHLNQFFAALSDPTRRAIVEHLTAGPASVSDLAAPHPMALPTFMKHLKVLERAGLVQTIKKGRVRTCHLDATPLVTAQGWIAWQRSLWETRLDHLDQLALALDAEKESADDR
ncbi:ArsR/SmtB family transcription factor [Loktanella sp. M215]|uniref:ArsR/SmtB family transcription factor n=1 Tax=Loktanella sp. M215 TaxID=2675431 RepID=UPI001F001D14|nr:metalloregulator ArsR/SmtB family transcription factor [Loktanella sp. M215]MBU2358029.1 metalloregulator ArsR/SmtB family transcription factor [Alphaproteobacteria bacterium]MCF7698079.1 metalloregulator ArsR/SmtB family transcription factor [Loktanella sp. M215]